MAVDGDEWSNSHCLLGFRGKESGVRPRAGLQTLMKRMEEYYVPVGNGTSVARTITGHYAD